MFYSKKDACGTLSVAKELKVPVQRDRLLLACQKLREMEKIDERETDCVYIGHLPDEAQLLWRPSQAHGCDVNVFLMPANRSGI